MLAGDVDYLEKLPVRFERWPYDVLYVRGNHDLYFRPYERSISNALSRTTSGRLRFLERHVASYDGVRVVGCCLWTDFELVDFLDDVLLLNAAHGADYRCLRRSDGRLLSPSCVRAEHLTSVRWLEKTLHEPFDGKTIVVSHHAPHRRSLDPSYGLNWTSAAFASDLTRLLRRAKVWIHGHTHATRDYKIEGCRVLCNAAGSKCRPNRSFIPDLVIDI